MAWLLCQKCDLEIHNRSTDYLCPGCGGLVSIEAKKTPLQEVIASRQVESQVTRALPPFLYNPPRTVAEILCGGPSSAGHSVVSTYLSCPERSRLWALGLVPKRGEVIGIAPLDHLGFGSLIHALVAYRIVAGPDAAIDLIGKYEDLHPEDGMKALHMMKIYDAVFPLQNEPFRYLGVEAQVCSEVAPGVIRTVRYDSLVYYPNGERGVYSLENKTASRGGMHAMNSYRSQFVVQQSLWNANPFLVETYGPMRGVIANVLVKTIVPQAERVGPFDFSPTAQGRALEMMALPDRIRYPVNADGSYPRVMTACWGRYGPCPYIDGCWDDAWGNYEIKKAA